VAVAVAAGAASIAVEHVRCDVWFSRSKYGTSAETPAGRPAMVEPFTAEGFAQTVADVVVVVVAAAAAAATDAVSSATKHARVTTVEYAQRNSAAPIGSVLNTPASACANAAIDRLTFARSRSIAYRSLHSQQSNEQAIQTQRRRAE
jgi:hypothetical protein